ncbi:MAG: phosphodiester glycosidase family protein [Cyanobacteria bacterium Co-bin13]|nr:phosphodiester glycosidase family protein [Cyanobacteria bacterium Co-bin13]
MPRQRRTLQLLIGLALGLALGLLAALSSAQLRLAPQPAANAAPSEAAIVAPVPLPPQFESVELPYSKVYTVTIADPQAYPLRVDLPENLVPLDQMAQRLNALVAINAGFFDPNNGQTTSYVVSGQELVADPRQNPRLMGNPDLAAYLDRILNRSEFRRYDCEGSARYDITLHGAPVPANCTLIDAVGAGPQLLPQSTAYEEAFIDYGANGAISRDALGSRSRNARSAIGIKPDGSLVLVMAAQRPGVSPSGMSFDELSAFLTRLGVEKALNLDGGSSSSLFQAGTTHYGRLDQNGNWVRRPVKSILWVAQP